MKFLPCILCLVVLYGTVEAEVSEKTFSTIPCPIRGWYFYFGTTEETNAHRFEWKDDYKFYFFHEAYPTMGSKDSPLIWKPLKDHKRYSSETILRIHGKTVGKHTYRLDGLKDFSQKHNEYLLTYDGRPFLLTGEDFESVRVNIFIHIPKGSTETRLVVTEELDGTGAIREHVIFIFTPEKPVLLKRLGGSRDEPDGDKEIYK